MGEEPQNGLMLTRLLASRLDLGPVCLDCSQRENCKFRTLNIALRSFAIPNTDFIKIELQTCDTCFVVIRCISSLLLVFILVFDK